MKSMETKQMQNEYIRNKLIPTKILLLLKFISLILLMIVIMFLKTSCHRQTQYPEIQDMTEFRRSFSHTEGAFLTGSFEEGVIKSATIVLAQLESSQVTTEGYVIYQFSVIESLKNPSNDKDVWVYEPALASGELLYEKDQAYVLILSRTTDIYYENPVFYNFNNGRIMVSDGGNRSIQLAEAFGGKVNLKAQLKLKTYEALKTYIQKVQDDNTTIKADVFNVHGRFIETSNIPEIVDQTEVIVEMTLKEVQYENRLMKECLFEVKKNWKETTEQNIIVTIPKRMTVEPGVTYLACLFRDGNYTVAAMDGVINIQSEVYDTFRMAIKEWEVQDALEKAADEAASRQAEVDQSAQETFKALKPERPYIVDPEYAPYVAINKDMVGWFRIEGTDIDFPVLQGDDNDYYLKHDINNKEYRQGSIIMDYRCDIKNIARNTMVYGHNIKHGMMFNEITQYKNKDFFDTHPIIEYNTLYDHMKWQVFAVHVVDGGYGYSISYPLNIDQEYLDFLKDIDERNMFKTDMEVGLNDKILTLVTCSYEFDNARTIVHAKLIESIPNTQISTNAAISTP